MHLKSQVSKCSFQRLKNYDKGMDYDAWKIRVNSPTLGKVVTTSAAGRYQIVNKTWLNSVDSITVPFTGNVTNPKNPPFNKDNQDIVANFLLTTRLKNAGLSTSDIEIATRDINMFDRVLKSLQNEWESIKILRINGTFRGMTIRDVYDFFVKAYDVYKGN